jgi:serine/threonine protein kinase
LALPTNTVLDDTYRIVRVVGSGGFGITYEAEDIKLRMSIALKEYYPFDFGDRDASMSVRPKSDRHSQTFQWGRTNFLQEARTLARFEHPAIVRVTRVFEANSTAYMVMRFEQGQSFDAWLKSLGRPPTQEELDRIVAPVLDALEVMHAADFLHRDIAPDNVIVRTDGSPVLLDFGAARRAVAEMSRTLTGVVKAGYSPHEQYSSDSRLQGPWSDLYALGGTLYRAVTGRTPMEAALRVDQDLMPTAAKAAKGSYRTGFLAAIDACLKVRHSERPRSVAQLRPMLMGDIPMSRREAEPSRPRKPISTPPQSRRVNTSVELRPRPRRWPAVAAATVALLGGAYGGIEYMRWQPTQPGAATESRVKGAAPDVETARKAAADAAQRQADLDAARRRQEAAAAADAAAHQAALDAERRQKEAAEAAQRQADLEAEERRKADAERVAAEEAAQRKAAEDDQRRKAEEPVRTASLVLSAEDRAGFVKRVQTVLKEGRCYDGAINGRGGETQDELDQFVASAHKQGKAKPARIELAKATAGDFEAWLRDADDVKGVTCLANPKPPKQEAARPRREAARPRRDRDAEAPRARVERREPREREPASPKLCWGYKNEGLKPCSN